MIFVLTDGLNFLYMCILNEWGSDQKRSAAYLGALYAKERICVTQPFRTENCPNFDPIEICDLHSSKGIQAIMQNLVFGKNLLIGVIKSKVMLISSY